MDDVRLSSSSLPNEGFVQIVTKYNGIKSVCWNSLKNKAKDVVCNQLGYKNIESYSKKTLPSSDSNVEMISGDINCDGPESYLSQCSIITSTSNCSELSYIKCKFFDKQPSTYDFMSYNMIFKRELIYKNIIG